MDIIRIDPGPLTSVAAFYQWTIKPLHALSYLLREGKSIAVEWDLRSIEYKKINLNALIAFLSTAQRVRSYLQDSPLILITWNPRILTFLDDIKFISISKEWGIFRFQDEMLGGYKTGLTNPDTRIIAFPYSQPPSHLTEENAWKSWKDTERFELTRNIIKNSKKIFDSRRKNLGLPSNAKSIIATSTAELVLNSMLWGESPAFVGLQRSHKQISVVVADSGQGFLQSLHKNRWKNNHPEINTHTEALIIASLINNREYGLKKVINLITENGGWVEMSSYKSELRWSKPSWVHARNIFSENQLSLISMPETVVDLFGQSIVHASDQDKMYGYYRDWNRGVRGSRISFEFPINKEKTG